ncbi:cation-translocating P-type ATPase [Roseateles asaccharophilus]|uniref:Cu2+-exporting ATPase n=1 Tax=Roseateles asaccharophilus TaxID=582607 RepID=A0ABU2A437_9BURK|nr:cation-translocating P-type ATPase [Roseateles asaccharophilus]MDR7331950.1 Cu2+-exporting ATPase [Roseateles asaccharophilus]
MSAAPPGLPAAEADAQALAPFTTWPDGPAGAALSQLQVSGMYCAACAGLIEQTLLKLPGVAAASVNPASARLALRWQPSALPLADVLAALRAIGYGAAPDTAAPARELRRRERRQALWRVFVAGFLMMQVMMLATPAYVAEPGELTVDLDRLLRWGSWVLTLPVLVFSAGPFFSGAWRQLRAKRLGMDVPVALGIAVTFIASTGALFDPTGPLGHEVYFDSLTMFIALLLLARWFELGARHRAAEALEAVAGSLPTTAERLNGDGTSERVAPEALRPGDRIRVAAGEAFAADGTVLRGEGFVNEALLTGESAPVAKTVGDAVAAGSINLDGPLVMDVQRVGADTTAQGIVRLMQQAQSQRPLLPGLLEHVATWFTVGVLLLALGAAAAWWWLEPSRALAVAVAVLIVTCPCALTLAAPAAWLTASGALARRGLLLVDLSALERLCAVDTVVFDKTGTLSEDRLRLRRHWAEGAQADALLAVARSLAALSRHPQARSLAGGAEAGAWTDVREMAGRGIEARDASGGLWRLGAPAWVRERPDPAARLAFGNGDCVLWLDLAEAPRADAADTVAALRQAGLRVRLLSGDQPRAVARMAAALDIAHWQAGATPAAKLAAVRAWQADGERVLMVGDGINDAPVLAAADVRIAMGEGAMLARSAADALLVSNRLSVIPQALVLARKTRRVLRQNLIWAAAYNLACVPLALTGWLPPLAAGIGMAASSLFVVLNAQRLAR